MRKANTEHPVDQLLTMVQQKYNMNREEAEAKIGSNASQISRIRTDKREASPRFILKVYDRTGISIDEIRRVLQVQPL